MNPGIPVGNAPSILDRDYTITAQVTIPKGGAEGMIATLGGRFGGYGLYLSRSFNWWYRETLFGAQASSRRLPPRTTRPHTAGGPPVALHA